MPLLDDLHAMADLDADRMLHFLHALPEAAEAAFARGASVRPPLTSPRTILICGMGGSAISGDLIRTELLAGGQAPVIVHRGDRLPGFANADTLALFLSYSGQTAETLGCLREAIARRIPAVVVTSGGEAGRLAEAAGYPIVSVPPGWQPRAALGDLFFALLGVITRVDATLRPDVSGVASRLRALRERCAPEVPTAANPAKMLALALLGKTPVIVGTTPTTEAVALRWKCQLNENSKQTALYAALPEMSHNDIVNLTASVHDDHAIVLLTDPDDSELVTRQRAIAMSLIGPHTAAVHEIAGEGTSLLERQLTAIYLGDYASVYLAFLKGLDPTPVASIGELKRRMAAEGGSGRSQAAREAHA